MCENSMYFCLYLPAGTAAASCSPTMKTHKATNNTLMACLLTNQSTAINNFKVDRCNNNNNYIYITII